MKRLALIGAAVLTLAACGGPENTDPREGVVIISEDNCFDGTCHTLQKVCVGLDLYTDLYRTGDDVHRIDKASPECEAK